MADDFRESLRFNVDSSGSDFLFDIPVDEEEFIKKSTQNYVTLYNIPEVREYYTQVVTAILLAYNDRFGNNGLQLNYRFKAPKSIESKMKEYIEDKLRPSDVKTPGQPMYDGFAMKLITSEVPSLLYTRDQHRFFDKDKTLSKLVEERKQHYLFLEKMQEFKSKLVEDEFETPPKYNLNISQEEYFTNCIEVLKRSRSLIDPEEKKIIEAFDSQIQTMEDKLTVARDIGDSRSPISPRDLENPSTNFITFLNEFEDRMHNELAIAVLTRQFATIFKSHAELFDSLGISLSTRDTKEPKRKRTENGYESNFIYIDTLFGTIECQLQTYQQYEQGRTGMAAHMLYKTGDDTKDSIPRPIPIPSHEEMSKPEVAKDFFEKVSQLSPKKFSVTLGRDRTKDIEFGAFRNYYSIFSEIPPTHPLAPQFQQYFSVLRDRKDSPLSDYPDVLRQYNVQDIEDYLSSDKIEYIKKLSELWYSHLNDFAEHYSSTSTPPKVTKKQSDLENSSIVQTSISFSDDSAPGSDESR